MGTLASAVAREDWECSQRTNSILIGMREARWDYQLGGELYSPAGKPSPLSISAPARPAPKTDSQHFLEGPGNIS